MTQTKPKIGVACKYKVHGLQTNSTQETYDDTTEEKTEKRKRMHILLAITYSRRMLIHYVTATKTIQLTEVQTNRSSLFADFGAKHHLQGLNTGLKNFSRRKPS
jgi:hypothetical protein